MSVDRTRSSVEPRCPVGATWREPMVRRSTLDKKFDDLKRLRTTLEGSLRPAGH